MRHIAFLGALLLRGWDITATNAEQIVFNAMNFSKMEPYPSWFIDFNKRAERLGVPPAGGLVQSELSRTVPNPPPGTLQPPHVEFGSGPHRPRVAAFYCESGGICGASFGRVYLPDAVSKLTVEIRSVLETHGWMWEGGDGVVQPCILVHPETGHCALQLYPFSKMLAAFMARALKELRADGLTLLPPEIERILYNDECQDQGLTLVTPDGESSARVLTEEQTVEIYKAVLSTMELHAWKTNDLLLFDNILYGHCCMPSGEGEEQQQHPPLKLHALFADEVDTRTLLQAHAPACVQQGLSKPCRGAIQTVLDQLGPGGKKGTLTALSHMPDFVFRKIGKQHWANKKDHKTET